MNNKRILEINRQVAEDIQRDIGSIYRLLQSGPISRSVKKEAKRSLLKKTSFFRKCKIVIKDILGIARWGIHGSKKEILCVESDFANELKNLKNAALLLKFTACDKKELSFRVVVESDNNYFQEEAQTYPDLASKGYIAILVNSLDVGGLEQVVAHLARSIKKQGIMQEIWCFHSGGNVADELLAEGISVRVFNGNKRRLYQYAKDKPPALINTHYIQLDITPFQKRGIPVIEVVHNMYVVQSRKFWKLEKKKYQACSKIVAVSELSKKTYLNKLKLTESEKVMVIGNSAEEKEQITVNTNDIRAELNIKEDSFVFINVASIDSRKNQLSLIESFDIVASLVEEIPYLILIGNVIDEEYYVKIEKKIKKSRYGDYVKLLPYTNDIQSMYMISDAFVMNSYYEGWSIAATEALHSGLPIVHSRCGSAIELTQQGKYGIMISNPLSNIDDMSPEEIFCYMKQGIYGNLEELIIAMLHMFNAKDELRKYRENIKQSARTEFNQSKMVMEYLRLFEQSC